ncbi:MAG: competence/damage-inducible protein A [Clostridia bacterium]|nr:competence/damage-inducible protein A [Clostridia bacterium]
MNAEIISVGTELILGDIVNTDAQYLSQKLASMGIDVFYQSSVGDNPQRLRRVLSIAVSRSNIIILTGGLGPTQDDLTVKTVCDAVGIEMVQDEAALENIKQCFAKSGRELTENNLKQAMVPKGATVFQNTCGTAPGCAISQGEQCIILLPGPPSEMKAMFENGVAQYLMKYSDGVTLSKFVNIYGLGESKVAEMVGDLLNGSNPTVAPYAKDGEVALRVTAKAQNQTAADAMCREMVRELKNRLGTAVYGVDKDSIQQVVVEMLQSKRMTVSTAESCTAGLISKRITEISGSSEVFNMGAVTYSNESKNKMLDVPMEAIEKYGAVSPQVAALMAKGVREASGSDIGISITGIAGPKSDDSNKPVGLSYIALSDKNGEYVIESMKGEHHGREYIRYASSSEALNLIRLYLEAYPSQIKGVTLLTDYEPYKPEVTKAQPEFTETVPVAEKPQINIADFQIPVTEFTGSTEKEDVLASIAKIFGETVITPAPQSQPITEPVLPFEPNVQEEVTEDSVEETVEEIAEETVEETVVQEVAEETVEQPVEEVVEPAPVQVEEKQPVNEIEDIFNSISQKLAAETTPDIIEEESVENVADEQPEQQKQDSVLIRILKYFIPWKGDPKGEIVRKIVFVVALVTFIAVGIHLIGYYMAPVQTENLQKELVSIYKAPEKEEIPYASEISNPDFKDLLIRNKDTIGWIKIGDTNINYPVVQHQKDDYYLRLDFDGKYNRCGTIYANTVSNMEYNKESKNLVLYGHNMRDDKSMFSQLLRYRNLEFYKENPVITFNTIHKDGQWKIFAVMTTNSKKAHDNGKVFNYRRSDFTSEQDFMEWIEQCRIRSEINTPVDIVASDEILTLQTCAYEFDEARYIVMARRVRPGESADVEVGIASKNPNTVYPQIWYDKKGIKNPHASVAATTSPTEPITRPSIPTRPMGTDESTSATSTTNQSGTTGTANSTTKAPTQAPSGSTTTVAPTAAPTTAALTTAAPTTAAPTTAAPTEAPTDAPTDAPTEAPTDAPTDAPTEATT